MSEQTDSTIIEESNVGIAVYSKCKAYRYLLTRHWDASKHYFMVIGLNPSTATAFDDDPTIRRCIGYAKDWGYGGLLMTNLFAFRATDPKEMMAAENPIGTDNDEALLSAADRAPTIIAAWGTKGDHHCRAGRVCQLLRHRADIWCFKETKHGYPNHPLYLPKNIEPSVYREMQGKG